TTPMSSRAPAAACSGSASTSDQSVAQEVLDGGDHADLLDLGAALVAVGDRDHALVGVADAAQARTGILRELHRRLARVGGRLGDQRRLDVVEPGEIELRVAALLEQHPAADQLTA